jgi:hypothetical protein
LRLKLAAWRTAFGLAPPGLTLLPSMNDATRRWLRAQDTTYGFAQRRRKPSAVLLPALAPCICWKRNRGVVNAGGCTGSRCLTRNHRCYGAAASISSAMYSNSTPFLRGKTLCFGTGVKHAGSARADTGWRAALGYHSKLSPISPSGRGPCFELWACAVDDDYEHLW